MRTKDGVDVQWFWAQTERLLLGLYGKNMAFATLAARYLAPDGPYLVSQWALPRAGFEARGGCQMLMDALDATPADYRTVEGGTIFDHEKYALDEAFMTLGPRRSWLDRRYLATFLPISHWVDICEDAACQGVGAIVRSLREADGFVPARSFRRTCRALGTIAMFIEFVLAMRRHVVIYKSLGHLYTSPSMEEAIKNTIAFASPRINYWLWGKDWEDQDDVGVVLFNRWREMYGDDDE